MTRLLAAMVVLLLVGCTTMRPLPVQVQLSFVNDSGQPVTVQILGRTDEGVGASAGVAGSRKAIVLRVIADRCTYTYALPVDELPSPGSKNAFSTLQVETDFSLYATPAKSIVPVSDLINSQPPGFPLQPTAADCSPDAERPTTGLPPQ
jgi:hypothetical protein